MKTMSSSDSQTFSLVQLEHLGILMDLINLGRENYCFIMMILLAISMVLVSNCNFDINHNENQPDQEEDDLNPTDDGEATEKPQGASDHTQLGVELHLLVSLDVVEGGRVKEDLNQLQG